MAAKICLQWIPFFFAYNCRKMFHFKPVRLTVKLFTNCSRVCKGS
jgi:hypothetical protein